MSKIFTYVRVNKNNQSYVQEQIELLEKYIQSNNFSVYKNIEMDITSADDEKYILDSLKDCERNSTIIIADLNVFGRTIENILEIVKHILSKKIRILVVKQKLELIDDVDMLTQMVLGVISMTLGLEKKLMSLRTKEALIVKKLNGISLGKPVGTIQKSKFDNQRDKIEELLSVGLSVRKIAKLLGYNNHIGLNNYVKKRNIRENLPSNEDIIN